MLSLLIFGTVAATGQVKLILDTDIGGDADDLGAVSMLHHLMDRGECEILGIVSWSATRYAVPAIDALNRYYGHPDIPIGTRRTEEMGQVDWNYNRILAKGLGYRLDHDDVPDATTLYRRILQGAGDKDVVIVTIGPLKNIEDLLSSGPDSISPLAGRELIEKKVREFVIMGGNFPSGEWEWNFSGGMEGVTRNVLEQLNVTVTFTGYEVGLAIKTGEVLNREDPMTPLYMGYMHFSGHASWIKENFAGRILDNSSYDQTAVLYAVRGGTGTYWDRISGGTCVADMKGGNRWVRDQNSKHGYLVLKEDPEKMARLIESLMTGNF